MDPADPCDPVLLVDSAVAAVPADRSDLDARTPLTWRPLSGDLVPAWHRLVVDVAAADDAVDHLDADDLRDELAPWVDLQRDTALGLDGDGMARAFGLVQVRPNDVTLLRGSCWGAVDPAWRGRGIGRELLAWQVGRARDLVARRRAELGEPVPGHAGAEVDPGRVPDAARLLERAGLRPARWFSVMGRDLLGAAPLLAVGVSPVVVPPGLRLVPYAPELDEPLRLAHNEAFEAHWGFQPWTRETWDQWSTGHRSFRPDWSFAVLADGADGGVDGTGGAPQVAAYALSASYEADWEAQGYTEGWTAKLGVRAPWRGRGLARALLARSMQAFATSGMQSAGLDVDSENPTGAVALYTGLGYRVRRRTAHYQLEL